MSKYFYCYSMNLKKFLMDSGLRYEWVGTNPKTNTQYFKFKRCKRLDLLLNEWSKNN